MWVLKLILWLGQLQEIARAALERFSSCHNVADALWTLLALNSLELVGAMGFLAGIGFGIAGAAKAVKHRLRTSTWAKGRQRQASLSSLTHQARIISAMLRDPSDPTARRLVAAHDDHPC